MPTSKKTQASKSPKVSADRAAAIVKAQAARERIAKRRQELAAAETKPNEDTQVQIRV